MKDKPINLPASVLTQLRNDKVVAITGASSGIGGADGEHVRHEDVGAVKRPAIFLVEGLSGADDFNAHRWTTSTKGLKAVPPVVSRRMG